MVRGWNYFATTLRPDGRETLLASGLPLSEVTANLALSAPTSLEATVPIEVPSLPGMVPFKTAIYAELDGVIRGAGLLHTVDQGDAELGLSCVGWTSYLAGQPWPGGRMNFTGTDPFIIARILWKTAQKPAGADIGARVVCEPEHTPVQLGQIPAAMYQKVAGWVPWDSPLPDEGKGFVYHPTKSDSDKVMYGVVTRDFDAGAWAKPVKGKQLLFLNTSSKALVLARTVPSSMKSLVLFGVVTDDAPTNPDGSDLEPWPLTWWDVPDMGSRWDDLAKDGGFDYVERHYWTQRPEVLLPGDDVGIAHDITLGYPQIGRRRDDLRFVVGENVIEVPSVEADGDYYADVIEVRGAGEGEAMKHAQWPVPNTQGRLRRVKVVTDESIRSDAGCLRRAQVLARAYADEQNITSLVVDTDRVDGWSWGVGDLITVEGSGRGWSGGVVMTVRILGAAITPDSGDKVALTVSRSERVTDS